MCYYLHVTHVSIYQIVDALLTEISHWTKSEKRILSSRKKWKNTKCIKLSVVFNIFIPNEKFWQWKRTLPCVSRSKPNICQMTRALKLSNMDMFSSSYAHSSDLFAKKILATVQRYAIGRKGARNGGSAILISIFAHFIVISINFIYWYLAMRWIEKTPILIFGGFSVSKQIFGASMLLPSVMHENDPFWPKKYCVSSQDWAR